MRVTGCELLLDSQVVLWSLQSPERLPAEVVAAITDPLNSVDVSVASLWELARAAWEADMSVTPLVLDAAVQAGWCATS